MALEIARKLPNKDLGRLPLVALHALHAALELLLASFTQDCERAKLKKQASKLVNEISQYTLAKRDLSLWCRAKLWLSL